MAVTENLLVNWVVSGGKRLRESRLAVFQSKARAEVEWRQRGL